MVSGCGMGRQVSTLFIVQLIGWNCLTASLIWHKSCFLHPGPFFCGLINKSFQLLAHHMPVSGWLYWRLPHSLCFLMQRDLQIITGLVKKRLLLSHQELRQMSVVLWKWNINLLYQWRKNWSSASDGDFSCFLVTDGTLSKRNISQKANTGWESQPLGPDWSNCKTTLWSN